MQNYYEFMDVAFVINTHTKHTDVIIEAIESILVYGSNKVLVLVDGTAWHYYKDLVLPVAKIEGFRHGCCKAPYRNVALALKMVVETWPEQMWYCYCEYDVLFASERFKHNLKMADDMGIWMLGNDGRVDEQNMPLVQALLGEKLKSSYYLLGCCQFFHRNFMEKLNDINFFDRFLTLTSGFSEGRFPLYTGYDLSEHMYPSLCRHFGGNVGVFATWDGSQKKWHGASEYFPMRWNPNIDSENDPYKEASIIHPLKSFDDPIRVYHREKRQAWKILQEKEKQSV